jgi:hypothetical protein
MFDDPRQHADKLHCLQRARLASTTNNQSGDSEPTHVPIGSLDEFSLMNQTLLDRSCSWPSEPGGGFGADVGWQPATIAVNSSQDIPGEPANRRKKALPAVNHVFGVLGECGSLLAVARGAGVSIRDFRKDMRHLVGNHCRLPSCRFPQYALRLAGWLRFRV